MKVLSIDIGIKNLAHCLFEVDETLRIQDWSIINLDNSICKCSKKATLQLGDELWCKPCVFKSSELITQCTKLITGTKDEMEKALKKKVKPIPPPTLVELGKQIMIHYKDLSADVVLIENQIGPLASKMKAIQGMVIQYWLMRNAKVECISACNKLKLFHTGKTTYTQRKKLSVHYTTQLLTLNQLETGFLKNKKKDDLADTFLQGVWYFHNNNCGLLKINCS